MQFPELPSQESKRQNKDDFNCTFSISSYCMVRQGIPYYYVRTDPAA